VAQTLSFLTYVLRGFADRMKPYQEHLSKAVIQLLLNCPASSITSRKVSALVILGLYVVFSEKAKMWLLGTVGCDKAHSCNRVSKSIL